jgi:carboxylesterase
MGSQEHHFDSSENPSVADRKHSGRRLGCVLVHGLSSTPQSLQGWATAFNQHGIDTRLVLLPGHGRQPEDLLLVQWPEWYASVVAAVEDLRRTCDRVFVLGQSLGGTLALRAAAHADIDGVITLAAIAYLKDWRLWFLPLMRPLKRWRQSPDNDIARQAVDTGSYDRLPFHSIEQLLELAAQVRRDLPSIRVPALLVQSTEDHVAPPGNLDYIHQHIGSADKERLQLHRSYHVISLDYDRDMVIERSIRFLHRVGYGDAAQSS